MKRLLLWILIVIIVVAVAVFAYVVFPGPQIRQVWQAINTPALIGPQGPKGNIGPMGPQGPAGQNADPAVLLQDPAFLAAVKQALNEPASASTPATPLVATCILDSFPENARFGVQLMVKQLTGTDWEFDPSHASRVVGDATHPELKTDADLSGCPVLVEGRKVLIQEHHIWIVIPGDKQYLDADGIFRAKEFSAWAYPSNWNMEDFSTAKAPIAGEFVDAKRNNMKANGYDWPIFVHLSSGSTLEFKPGTKVGAVLPNNCDFAAPSRLNVTGIYNSTTKSFDASIGAENCWTAAKINGSWNHWQNAKDNVVFTTVDAWLMPSTFTEQNTLDWIATQQ